MSTFKEFSAAGKVQSTLIEKTKECDNEWHSCMRYLRERSNYDGKGPWRDRAVDECGPSYNQCVANYIGIIYPVLQNYSKSMNEIKTAATQQEQPK